MKPLLLALLPLACSAEPDSGDGWVSDLPVISDHLPIVCDDGKVCLLGDICIPTDDGDKCCAPTTNPDGAYKTEDGWCKLRETSE